MSTVGTSRDNIWEIVSGNSAGNRENVWILIPHAGLQALRVAVITCATMVNTQTHTGFYQVARKQKTAPHNLLNLAASHNLATPLSYTNFTSQNTTQISEYTPTQRLPTRLPHGLVR